LARHILPKPTHPLAGTRPSFLRVNTTAEPSAWEAERGNESPAWPTTHGQAAGGSPTLARRGVRLFALSLAACCLVFSSSGCVYRRLIVRSDPPGAQVILDGQEVGNTPVAVPFTYYGTRQLTIVKPGYETRTELVKIPAPWYQWMPLDFVSDNFLPRQVNDRHEICWQMTPQGVVPQEKLQERADSLRSEAHIGQ
jgi:hypothetical protein